MLNPIDRFKNSIELVSSLAKNRKTHEKWFRVDMDNLGYVKLSLFTKNKGGDSTILSTFFIMFNFPVVKCLAILLKFKLGFY